MTDDFNGAFQIDPVTGEIVVLTPLNHELTPVATVEVTATSDDGSTSVKTFDINILDVNESPITSLVDNDVTTNEVTEHSPVGTIVGLTAFANDPDGTDEVTYMIANDPSGVFQVHPVTGVVTVANPTVLDFDDFPTVDLEITATSDDGSTVTETFTIKRRRIIGMRWYSKYRR